MIKAQMPGQLPLQNAEVETFQAFFNLIFSDKMKITNVEYILPPHL